MLLFVHPRPKIKFSIGLLPNRNHFLRHPVHPHLREDVMPNLLTANASVTKSSRCIHKVTYGVLSRDLSCTGVLWLSQPLYWDQGWLKMWKKNLTLSEGLIWTQAFVCTYLPSIMMWISEGLLYSELSPQVVPLVCFQSHRIVNCFPNLIFEELIVLESDTVRLFSCSIECLCSAFIVSFFWHILTFCRYKAHLILKGIDSLIICPLVDLSVWSEIVFFHELNIFAILYGCQNACDCYFWKRMK